MGSFLFHVSGHTASVGKFTTCQVRINIGAWVTSFLQNSQYLFLPSCLQSGIYQPNEKFHFIGLLFVCLSYVLTSTILPSTTTMQRVLLRCPWYWKFRTLAIKYKALKYFEKYVSNSVDTYVTSVWIIALCHVDSRVNTLTITERANMLFMGSSNLSSI